MVVKMEDKKIVEEKKPKKPVISKKLTYGVIVSIAVLYLLGYALGSIWAAFIIMLFVAGLYGAWRWPKSREWLKKHWAARKGGK